MLVSLTFIFTSVYLQISDYFLLFYFRTFVEKNGDSHNLLYLYKIPLGKEHMQSIFILVRNIMTPITWCWSGELLTK